MSLKISIKKNLPGFIFAFLLPVIVILIWWGAFNHTDVRQAYSPPLHYVYMDFYGDMADVADVQNKVRDLLKAQHVSPGNPVIVLYTDPRHTKKDEQRAHIGFMAADNAVVAPPLHVDTLPARNVLRASVQASIQLAPGMAYQALHDYLKPQGKDIRLPTVEIYSPGNSISRMGTLTVDMPD